MVYTADKPQLAPDSDVLRRTIPGWGADLDPNDRPAVPKERFDPGRTGAHWEYPETQEELVPRERSIEHQHLTPVFGTTVPLKGLSGLVRRLAYRRYSEARAAHWLLLIAGDRIDAVESHLASLVKLRPDNLIAETGVRSELTHHGVASRLGRHRADLSHAWMDPLLVGSPWLLGALLIAKLARRRARPGRPGKWRWLAAS